MKYKRPVGANAECSSLRFDALSASVTFRQRAWRHQMRLRRADVGRLAL